MPPWLVRNLLVPVHERLMGRPTMRYWRELEASQWCDQQQLRSLQRRKLRDLLSHAWDRCPAHRQRLADAGLTRSDAAHFAREDLRELPLLSKKDIRNQLNDYVDWQCPGGVLRYTTGGSTGEPLIFYFDRRRQAYDQAARMRTHHWFGVKPGEREVYLWGAPVELRSQDRLKAARDRLTNQILLSAFEMSPETMTVYLKRIGRFKPACLFGYPSSLAMLAEFATQHGEPVRWPTLKAVFATGEVLYDHQKQLIQEAFRAPVANGYGSRDAGFIAHDCMQGSMHVTDENVIVEVVDANGAAVEAGEEGELLVTHLDNYALPFIRYRTGDSARLLEGDCPCGRALGRIEICGGRTTDQLLRKDGTAVHALALIYTIRDLPGVQQFKIIQESLERVTVNLVVENDFSPSFSERIKAEFRARLGGEVDVNIEQVLSIATDRSGKFRYVTSFAQGQKGISRAWDTPAE